MMPVGLLVVAVGIFSGVGAVICFRRAANPMAALERYKARYGIDYARNISDPVTYSAHATRMSTVSGIFLSLLALGLIIAGVIVTTSPSAEERRAAAGRALQAMQQSDERMRQEMQRQNEERMNHIFDVTPAQTQPRK